MSETRSHVEPVDDLVIVRSVELPVPASQAFALFSSAAALESWLCRRAAVDLRVGGRYELFWDLADAENDSTIGCRITALDAARLIAFQWRSPRQFKAFANAADPLTHVVVSCHETNAATRVTLVHSGWRATAEWQAAAAWQGVAWDHALRALVQRAGRG